jgi:hypothetical protein
LPNRKHRTQLAISQLNAIDEEISQSGKQVQSSRTQRSAEGAALDEIEVGEVARHLLAKGGKVRVHVDAAVLADVGRQARDRRSRGALDELRVVTDLLHFTL